MIFVFLIFQWKCKFCRFCALVWLEIFYASCTYRIWPIRGTCCHSSSCKASRMLPYGPPVVHILPTIRRNNCDRLLRGFCRACIMDWDVDVVPWLVDFSCVIWAPAQHSVAMVRISFCLQSSTQMIWRPLFSLEFFLMETGIICIFVLGAFVFINFYRKEEGFVTDIPQTEDPHKVSDSWLVNSGYEFMILLCIPNFSLRWPKKQHI